MIKKMREQKYFSTLLIITVKAVAKDRDLFLEIGTAEYLEKPIEVTKFFHLKNKFISNFIYIMHVDIITLRR